MSIKVAKFRDVSEGLQPRQFAVGDHDQMTTLSDLPEIYKQLMDRPIPVIFGLIGNDGRVNMTPMWFDYGATTCSSTSPRTARRWSQHQGHGGARDPRGRPGRSRSSMAGSRRP